MALNFVIQGTEWLYLKTTLAVITGVLVSIQWAEVRDAAKEYTLDRAAPYHK